MQIVARNVVDVARAEKEALKSHIAKQRIYEQFARLGKALASPARLELLDLLVQGERSVESLAIATRLSVANASQHLRVLASARLVDSRRIRQYVFYRLADQAVLDLWQTLRRSAEGRLVELESITREYLLHRDKFERIARSELLQHMKNGTVTLIDVRPAYEFAQGHLPRAISVPVDDIESWATDFVARVSKRNQVVAYCRGPYCVWALEAVAQLRRHGIRAAWFGDGVGEWRAAGLPLEQPGAAGNSGAKL